MEDIKNNTPTFKKVEEIFNLLFTNELVSKEANYDYRFINAFLVNNNDFIMDETFIILLIEYATNFLNNNKGKYYRYMCNYEGILKVTEVEKGKYCCEYPCEPIIHHIILCLEMLRYSRTVGTADDDITKVDIRFLDNLLNAYEAVSKLISHKSNEIEAEGKKVLRYTKYDMTSTILHPLSCNELVGFICYLKAKLSNPELIREEKNIQIIADAFLEATNILYSYRGYNSGTITKDKLRAKDIDFLNKVCTEYGRSN